MVQLLSIGLTPLQEINPEEYNRKALVDNQPSHHELLGPYKYDVIIDHHPGSPKPRPGWWTSGRNTAPLPPS